MIAHLLTGSERDTVLWGCYTSITTNGAPCDYFGNGPIFNWSRIPEHYHQSATKTPPVYYEGAGEVQTLDAGRYGQKQGSYKLATTPSAGLVRPTRNLCKFSDFHTK